MSLGRVLVVDDEPQVAAMLRDLLGSLDYESEIATSGRDALRLVSSYRPDVVLLDIWMPQLMGGEVLAALRDDHPDVPVVVVASSQDATLARQMLARGAFDYVRTPFDIDALGRTLATAMVYRGDGAGEPARAGEAEANAATGPQRVVHGTILYIEDTPTSVRQLETLLRQRPRVQLLTAATGGEGLRLARERRPDVVLLDLHLPDMPGQDVLCAIRGEAALARTAVIVASTEDRPELPARIRALGAQGYLLKPFAFPQFFTVIDAHLWRSVGPGR